MTTPILVTGATGHSGRHVVAGLLAEGASVRALVRDPARADLPDGVEVVAGDLTDPESVAVAAKGVSAVYLVWPFFSGDGVEEAVRALDGRRVVYLSAVSASDENSVWGKVEAAVREAAAEWTFVRVSGLAVNALAWAAQVPTGVVLAPYGGAARSLVHERDVAAVAVRALLDDGHAGKSYATTGPESITQAEQVRLIGEALGRPVRWEEQPLEEARTQLRDALGDAEFADNALGYWASLVDAPEPASPDVAAILGRPALSFAEWARDHVADFGG